MTGFLMKALPLAAMVLTATAAMPAQAQMVCGKRDDIVRQLEAKYGETRRSIGLQQGRGVVEVYASEMSGSWTILVTDPRGMSCLMAAGEAFEVEQVADKKETPA